MPGYPRINRRIFRMKRRRNRVVDIDEVIRRINVDDDEEVVRPDTRKEIT